MSLDTIKKLPPFERLAYWIDERESVRRRREHGDTQPWTDDPIIAKYRFCNIRRMDDRVSQWILNNWLIPYKSHKNMVIACAMARFFNLPSTLEAIGFPESYRPENIKKKLRALKDVGTVIFNGAYMVRGNDGQDKIASVIDFTITPLFKKPIYIFDSMQKCWSQLQSRYGFGSFMAGQVIADLRHGFAGDWPDKNTWAPKGPGSRRGMNRLYQRDIALDIPQGQFEEELIELIKKLKRTYPQRTYLNRLEAMDFQNCLCEFDKYERTLFDGRRPKQVYRMRE